MLAFPPEVGLLLNDNHKSVLCLRKEVSYVFSTSESTSLKFSLLCRVETWPALPHPRAKDHQRVLKEESQARRPCHGVAEVNTHKHHI